MSEGTKNSTTNKVGHWPHIHPLDPPWHTEPAMVIQCYIYIYTHFYQDLSGSFPSEMPFNYFQLTKIYLNSAHIWSQRAPMSGLTASEGLNVPGRHPTSGHWPDQLISEVPRIFGHGAVLLLICSILATLWSLNFHPFAWCFLHFGARPCHVIGICSILEFSVRCFWWRRL